MLCQEYPEGDLPSTDRRCYTLFSSFCLQSAGALRDSLRKAYGANTWNNAASDYGRTNGAYGDRASRSGDKAQAASSGYVWRVI